MKASDLIKRVDGLSEKFNETKPAGMVHLDFDSFSEAEKLLLQKVREIEEKYLHTGSEENLIENAKLVFKSMEIIYTRVRELYCHVTPIILRCGEDKEIVEHFFRLHFYNFESDIVECLTRVQSWTEKDREKFVRNLRKYGPLYFRIPRGFNEENNESFLDLNNSKDSGDYSEKKEDK